MTTAPAATATATIVTKIRTRRKENPAEDQKPRGYLTCDKEHCPYQIIPACWWLPVVDDLAHVSYLKILHPIAFLKIRNILFITKTRNYRQQNKSCDPISFLGNTIHTNSWDQKWWDFICLNELRNIAFSSIKFCDEKENKCEEHRTDVIVMIKMVHSFIPSFLHSFIPLFLHSFIPSHSLYSCLLFLSPPPPPPSHFIPLPVVSSSPSPLSPFPFPLSPFPFPLFPLSTRPLVHSSTRPLVHSAPHPLVSSPPLCYLPSSSRPLVSSYPLFVLLCAYLFFFMLLRSSWRLFFSCFFALRHTPSRSFLLLPSSLAFFALFRSSLRFFELLPYPSHFSAVLRASSRSFHILHTILRFSSLLRTFQHFLAFLREFSRFFALLQVSSRFFALLRTSSRFCPLLSASFRFFALLRPSSCFLLQNQRESRDLFC